MSVSLETVYGESFSAGQSDLQFTVGDLDESGRLLLDGVLPGAAMVVDSSGGLVSVPQTEKIDGGICTGVYLNFSGISVSGTWKIRFRRGPRGASGNVMSDDEMIKWSLIFS